MSVCTSTAALSTGEGRRERIGVGISDFRARDLRVEWAIFSEPVSESEGDEGMESSGSERDVVSWRSGAE